MDQDRLVYRNVHTGDIVEARPIHVSGDNSLLEPDIAGHAGRGDWEPGIVGTDGTFHPAEHSGDQADDD